ncbi:hypothetical protein K2X40_00065 [Candidatus Babeliales bacterium]|nr:hypothetical protein [Candidatus Babeliales bacterium]
MIKKIILMSLVLSAGTSTSQAACSRSLSVGEKQWLALEGAKKSVVSIERLQEQLNDELFDAMYAHAPDEKILELFKRGASVHAVDKRRQTPWPLLTIGAAYFSPKVIEHILNEGVDVNLHTNPQTPLLMAVNSKRKDNVWLLLFRGADATLVGFMGTTVLGLMSEDPTFWFEDQEICEHLALQGLLRLESF